MAAETYMLISFRPPVIIRRLKISHHQVLARSRLAPDHSARSRNMPKKNLSDKDLAESYKITAGIQLGLFKYKHHTQFVELIELIVLNPSPIYGNVCDVIFHFNLFVPTDPPPDPLRGCLLFAPQNTICTEPIFLHNDLLCIVMCAKTGGCIMILPCCRTRVKVELVGSTKFFKEKIRHV